MRFKIGNLTITEKFVFVKFVYNRDIKLNKARTTMVL